MATRGAIARLRSCEPLVFAGAYHHWDSYPTGLGKTLWELYHGHFQKDLEAMLQTLIDAHPAGWSSIHSSDFSQTPGFVETNFTDKNFIEASRSETRATETQATETLLCNGNGQSAKVQSANAQSTQDCADCDEGSPPPSCYCHGDRHEAAWVVTEKNAAGSGIEWVYAFSEGDILSVLRCYTQSPRRYQRAASEPQTTPMIGMFGSGDPEAAWHVVERIELNGVEPDWNHLEDKVHGLAHT